MSSTRVPAVVGSGAAHVLLIGAVLLLSRHNGVLDLLTPATSPARPDIVWPVIAGAAGGGGGGGAREIDRFSRARSPGHDRPNDPVAARSEASPQSGDQEPFEAPLLAARSVGTTDAFIAGASDQRADLGDARGFGSQDGADGGIGNGSRGGDGDGVGPGTDRGEGGPVFDVGNLVVAPRLLSRRAPVYTDSAMRARLSGRVLLECLVEPDGRVGRVRVLRSLDPLHGLDAEAIKAVRAWRFAPGTRFGVRVRVRITIETSFTIH